MLLSTRIINVTGAYLYPAYASYKALGRRPAQPAELEQWLMYWALLGAWTAVEGVVGWFLEWIPMYTIGKTLVFLYLAQPGNRIAPYLYCNILAPLFAENEGEIDAFLGSLSGRASTHARGGLWWVWDQLRRVLGLSQEQATQLSNAAGLPHPPPYGGAPGAGAPGSGGPFGGIGMGGPPAAGGAPGAQPAYAQQAFGLVSNLATKYMPAALGAVYAAGNQFSAGQAQRAPSASGPSSGMTGSVGSRSLPPLPGSGSNSGTPVRGFDLPPLPSVPTGPLGVTSRTTSRTLAFATDGATAIGLAADTARVRTTSRTSSDGSLSGKSGSGGSASLAASGFAEIQREEAEGAEMPLPPVPPPPHARQTSGSWMRWSKDKAE